MYLFLHFVAICSTTFSKKSLRDGFVIPPLFPGQSPIKRIQVTEVIAFTILKCAEKNERAFSSMRKTGFIGTAFVIFVNQILVLINV